MMFSSVITYIAVNWQKNIIQQYIESLLSLEKYIKTRETTDQYNEKSKYGFMKLNIFTIIGRMPWIGVGISDHMKVHYKFNNMFLQTYQEMLYLKEIF